MQLKADERVAKAQKESVAMRQEMSRMYEISRYDTSYLAVVVDAARK